MLYHTDMSLPYHRPCCAENDKAISYDNLKNLKMSLVHKNQCLEINKGQRNPNSIYKIDPRRTRIYGFSIYRNEKRRVYSRNITKSVLLQMNCPHDHITPCCAFAMTVCQKKVYKFTCTFRYDADHLHFSHDDNTLIK